MNSLKTRRLVVAALAICTALSSGAEPPQWTIGRTEQLADGSSVSISEPVLVARSSGYLWFPTLAKTADGALLAVMSDYADVSTSEATCRAAWSENGGVTWSKIFAAKYGDVNLTLPTGDLILLPYYLRPSDGGLEAPYQIVGKGSRELRTVDGAVQVTGWPRPLGSLNKDLGLGGFVFNGQSLTLENGVFFATLYGHFEGDKTYSLVGAESQDGAHWKIRSVIADVSAGFKGSGPCEAAVCRLKDRRLMCVFRNDGNLEYGQTWSSDDGLTWEKPVLMAEIRSVQPSLVVLDDGAVVLSGGRPGLFVWLNADGRGKSWQPVGLVANHNATRPADPITNPAAGGNTSSYTEIVSLGGGHLLVIYDRLARGWHAIPKDSPETNSVWVVRLGIQRAKAP